MLRKLVVSVAALLVPGALVLAATTAPANAGGPPKATGIANCHINTGSGVLSPPLTPAGSPGAEKVHFTASLTFASGPCGNADVVTPPGVTILGGTVTGVGVFKPPAGGNASSCANFDGPDILHHFTVKVAWKTAGPAIARTKIVYAGNAGSVTGVPDTVSLNTPPATAAAKSGSFAAPPTLHTVTLDTNIPGPACAGSISTFLITGGVVTV
jgi:hypothetical protein